MRTDSTQREIDGANRARPSPAVYVREARAILGRIPREELLAALLAIGTGITILALKFYAYLITGSAAIFSDALESIVNVLASGFAFYALAVAHTPPDAEHPYGHGKIEFLSAGFEGGMIFLAALVIVARTMDTMLFHTLEVEELALGLALITVAMLGNGLVGLILIRTGRRRSSATLEADGWHLLSDAITTVAALVALFLVKAFNWRLADPIGALLMAAYIGYMGFALMRRSIRGLMDRQDVADERLLRGILDAHVGRDGKSPTICSYHKLRHRHSGRYHWVDLHVMVPPDHTVDQGHDIASTIEKEIEDALGEGDATAHIEPCRAVSCTHPGRAAGPLIPPPPGA